VIPAQRLQGLSPLLNPSRSSIGSSPSAVTGREVVFSLLPLASHGWAAGGGEGLAPRAPVEGQPASLQPRNRRVTDVATDLELAPPISDRR
jgi:hypothetical protein